jgi:hypothetical protein
MFCPEDGTQLGPVSAAGIYPPCPKCEVTWCYNGENGVYEVWDGQVQNNFGKVLQEEGKKRQDQGITVLVANLIDAMKEKARSMGQFTYYTGTYIVARDTIVNAGITCELDPSWRGAPPDRNVRWVSFFGDDWEYLQEREVIQMLLDERS